MRAKRSVLTGGFLTVEAAVLMPVLLAVVLIAYGSTVFAGFLAYFGSPFSAELKDGADGGFFRTQFIHFVITTASFFVSIKLLSL